MLETLGVIFLVLLAFGAFIGVVSFCAYMSDLAKQVDRLQTRVRKLEGKE